MSVKGEIDISVESKGFLDGPIEQFSEAGALYTRNRPKFAPFQREGNKDPLDEYRKLSNPSSSSDSDGSSESSDEIQEADLREVDLTLQSKKADFQDTVSNGLTINKDTKFKFDSWFNYEEKEDLLERSFFEEASHFEELYAIFRGRTKNIGEARSDSCDLKGHRDALIPMEKTFGSVRQASLLDERSRAVEGKDFLRAKDSPSSVVSPKEKGLSAFKLISTEGFFKGSRENNLSRLCSKESQITNRTMKSLSKEKPSGTSMVYLVKQRRETLIRVTCASRIADFCGGLFSHNNSSDN